MGGPSVVWVEGALQDADAWWAAAAGDVARDAPGCYTTARWSGGRARFAEAHGLRLARDARALGLGSLDPARALRAFAELGRAAFGPSEGVLRLEASCDPRGRLRLVGVPRALGDEPAHWRALRAPFSHPGPQPYAGAKRLGQAVYTRARDAARASGADDALLFDAAGRLVEGARTNALVVLAGGAIVTPPLARGGVAGIALALLRAAHPEIAESDVDAALLGSACELVLVNAVRGAVPVLAVDGTSVGDGAAGPWSARLARTLADAPQPGC